MVNNALQFETALYFSFNEQIIDPITGRIKLPEQRKHDIVNAIDIIREEAANGVINICIDRPGIDDFEEE